MNLRKTLSTLAVAGIFFVSAGLSNAAGTSQCQIVYGGGQVCQEKVEFTIDKKVLQPTKGGSYVENLTVNDTRFNPEQEALFQITVKNTGSENIPTLTVTDNLPSYLVFKSGPGTYNSVNNTITYTFTNLAPGATNQQTIVTTIVNKDKLPQNQSVTCVNNNVRVNDNNGNTASDTASLCIETPVVNVTPTPMIYNKVPVKNIPNTGPEMLPLLGLIPAGIAGFVLRKKSRIN